LSNGKQNKIEDIEFFPMGIEKFRTNRTNVTSKHPTTKTNLKVKRGPQTLLRMSTLLPHLDGEEHGPELGQPLAVDGRHAAHVLLVGHHQLVVAHVVRGVP